MKKTWKVFLTIVAALLAVVLVACGQGTASKDNKEAELKKIDFILDWTPNTNHTGLYVAKEKGYFKEAGVDVDLKLPPEESSSDLVINGKAPFAIYFQDYMAKKLEKGAGITAVAAIVEHNTSGIISRKSDNINSPKDLVGKKYGTWNDPTELAMLKTLVESQGGDFEKVEKVPNNDSNSITPIANGVFDSAWIYYGWDGILAKSQGVDANFMYLKDYVKEFDYYSPVIIANNDYLKDNKEEARKVIQAIKKGYQYAMDHPEEAADILIKNAPELKDKRDFVIESQKYLSKEYASDKEKWGQFDADRWNAFYKWDKENGILKEAGVDVDLKLPPEESSSDLVINGKAPFAVYFQDYMAKKLEKGAGITAVAAIVEHNTSGIISRKSDNVASPKDLVGKKYGTWNDPTELAMLKTLVESQGGDFEKVEKVPNNDSNSITPIANGVFDTAWIYYGWDGILAKSQGVEANFMYLKDYVKEFDYYSPVIIANNDYLKDNKEEARKVIQAIKKGYQYAMEHPEEAADILIKNAPELQEKRDFVIESQKYLSKEYASDKEKWGQFDAARWNAFYKWDKENGILKEDLTDKGFTNEFVK